jgi:hypothetical protein
MAAAFRRSKLHPKIQDGTGRAEPAAVPIFAQHDSGAVCSISFSRFIAARSEDHSVSGRLEKPLRKIHEINGNVSGAD